MTVMNSCEPEASGTRISRESPFAFDWLIEHARRTPDAPAVGTPAGWTDFRELATVTRSLAASLSEQGVGPGGFVLLSLPPGPGAVASVLAVQATGACAVELHRDSDVRTIAAILEQTEAGHAIVSGREATRWAELAPPRTDFQLHVVHPSPPPPAMEELLRKTQWSWLDESVLPGSAAAWEPHRDPEAPALLVYTSGSTGIPRGVVQTHANVAANTEAIAGYLGLGPRDRALSILPLAYCYGRSILQTHLLVGASVFFDPRFTFPRTVMEALASERCTGFYGVPLTFELLRRQVDPRELDLNALRYVAQAGGAMRAETIRWVREAFAPVPLFVMYGQTEATARLSYLPPDRADDKAGSIGRGLANVELRVVDEDFRETRTGEVGELVARGPSITPGYFRAPEETAAVLRDGWLRTGDLGWRDQEGFVFLVGRAKDVMKLGGHRVTGAELERTLVEYPGVAEVAVVGVTDAAGDEAAAAFLVAEKGASLDPTDVRRFCRGRLPAFKVPRFVRVVAALPRTASGKVAKGALREAWVRDESVLEGRADTGSGTEGG